MMWKGIVGYEGLYEVSDAGEIRSLDRVIFVPGVGKGKGIRRLKGRLLSLRPQICGDYVMACLSKDGKATQNYVHRLVWESFKGPIPPKYEINHIDTDKSNNYLYNLECVTRKVNMKHALDNGLTSVGCSGSGNLNAILDEDDVREIRRRIDQGESQRSMIALFGISRSAVSSIYLRKTWAHVE